MKRHAGFRSFDAPSRQRGVVLIVALIFLVLITMLAVASSGTSMLQQKLAGGQRNAQLALWSAETAIRGAEWRLWRASADDSTRLTCGSSPLSNCYDYDPNPAVTSKAYVFRTATGWVTDGGTKYDAVGATVESADKTMKLGSDPYYIIEDMGVELPPGSGSAGESGATGKDGTGYTSTNRHLYRITARGMGNNTNAIRVIETTFAAKSD